MVLRVEVLLIQSQLLIASSVCSAAPLPSYMDGLMSFKYITNLLSFFLQDVAHIPPMLVEQYSPLERELHLH